MSEFIRHKGNGTKAAIAAGFAPGSAHVAASRLLRKGKVKRQLDKLTRKYEITPERVLSRLDGLSVAAQEANNYAAAVRAEELIGKSLGMWVDRSVNVNLDLTGEHVAAIRALASRRIQKNTTAPGDDAKTIEGQATIATDNATFHNVGYASGDDKDVIDQRVSETRTLKQSRKPASDVDGNNI